MSDIGGAPERANRSNPNRGLASKRDARQVHHPDGAFNGTAGDRASARATNGARDGRQDESRGVENREDDREQGAKGQKLTANSQRPMAGANENADSRLRSHRRLVLRLQALPADRSVGTQRSDRCRLLGHSSIGPRTVGFHTVCRNTVSSIAAWTSVRGIAAADWQPRPSPRRFRTVPGGPGSHRSAVSTCPVLPGAELLRLPIRLRGPRCFSTYTLHDCASLSIGWSWQFWNCCEIAPRLPSLAPDEDADCGILGCTGIGSINRMLSRKTGRRAAQHRPRHSVKALDASFRVDWGGSRGGGHRDGDELGGINTRFACHLRCSPAGPCHRLRI